MKIHTFESDDHFITQASMLQNKLWSLLEVVVSGPCRDGVPRIQAQSPLKPPAWAKMNRKEGKELDVPVPYIVI